jgi:hypothetical protein
MIQVSKSKERLRFSTGICTVVSDWDKKNRKSKTASINKKIREIEDKIEVYDNQCQLLGKEIDLGELADSVKSNPNATNKKKLFVDYIQMYYDAHKQSKAKNTIVKYKTLINFLTLHFPDLTINDVDSEFGIKLKNLCLGKKEADNTLNKRFKLIKVVINWCEDMKYISGLNLKNFTHPQTDKIDAVILNHAEIESIRLHDFSDKPNLSSIRDLFVIACHTGIDWSDLPQLTKKNLSVTPKGNKYFIIKRTKTEGKEILSYPPCNDIVFEILNKRKWKFDFISYDKSLQHLKTVCKTVGFKEPITLVSKSGNTKISVTKEKHEWIAWKTARRSNITNLMMDGKQTEMVMSAVGHKKSSTTAKYQHQHAAFMVDALVGD